MVDYCYVICKNKNRCKNKSIPEVYINRNYVICKFHSTYLKKNKSLTLIYNNESKIFELPNEILYKIMNDLKEESIENLINLRITCKKFLKFISEYIYKLSKNYSNNKLINLNIGIYNYNEFDYEKTNIEINKLIKENINIKINIKKNNMFKLVEYVDALCNYGYILYGKDINDIIKILRLNIFKKKTIKEITFTKFNEIETKNIVFSITYILDNKDIIFNYPDDKKDEIISNVNNSGWFIRSYKLILKKLIENLKKIDKINIMEINKFEYDLISSVKINTLKCNLHMIYSEKALYLRDNNNIDNILVLNTSTNKKLINDKYGSKFKIVTNNYFETIKRYC